MIQIQENVVKVAGKWIQGQVQSISVNQEGILKDKKNKKGKVIKTNQPAGYEAATVDVQILFEENGTYDRYEMIKRVQGLFKSSGQKKQKLYRIVEDQINSRGISEVYFNKFTTSGNVSESWYIGTLSFVAPKFAGIKIVRTKKGKASKKAAAAKKEAKAKKAAAKRKTSKDTSRSPARDTRSRTTAAKKAAAAVRK